MIVSIPVDLNMIANAKEAEKAGLDRITISVPIKDILYEQPKADPCHPECATDAGHSNPCIYAKS